MISYKREWNCCLANKFTKDILTEAWFTVARKTRHDGYGEAGRMMHRL